jgi:hypothetical protein
MLIQLPIVGNWVDTGKITGISFMEADVNTDSLPRVRVDLGDRCYVLIECDLREAALRIRDEIARQVLDVSKFQKAD